MQEHKDEELFIIFKVSTGSQRNSAFDCLYMRYSEQITQYFYFALNKDYEKAKDFSHDLFIKLLESTDKFDSKQLFKPWIYRVASNMCKNDFRKMNVINKFQEHVSTTSSPFTELNETEARLARCIRSLDQEHRSLIALRFKINLSIKEIAEIYECPEGTIKSRLFYATKELSKRYKQ